MTSMLGAAKLMAFVATTRPDAAKTFYTDVLGLTLAEDSPFALVFSSGGIMLRIQKMEAFTPPAFTVLGWEVPDIAASIAGLAAKGVAFERFGFLPQDDAGIWTAPNGDKIAWFKDPDGNTLSLAQFD